MNSNLKSPVGIVRISGGALLMVCLLFSVVALMMTSVFALQVLWAKNMNSYRQMLHQQRLIGSAADALGKRVLIVPTKCFLRYAKRDLLFKTSAWWKGNACLYGDGVYYLIEPYGCSMCFSSARSQCYYRISLLSVVRERVIRTRVMVGSGMLDCGGGVLGGSTLSWERVI